MKLRSRGPTNDRLARPARRASGSPSLLTTSASSGPGGSRLSQRNPEYSRRGPACQRIAAYDSPREGDRTHVGDVRGRGGCRPGGVAAVRVGEVKGSIDTEARDYLPHMYGAVNYTVIDEVRKLPLKVSDIYRRLTS